VRVPAQRFAPLVCIDDAGRYLGIVRMERLVEVQTRQIRVTRDLNPRTVVV